MSPRKPKTPLSEYDVYVWHRSKSKASRAGQKLGTDTLPSTWSHNAKTYYWSATDDVDHIVIYSEVDPRTQV
jgi:hypothetical protein